MHADDRDLIIRALDENLSPEEAQRLNRLLDTSPEAQAEWEAHRTVRTLIAEHGASSFGPDFSDQVMQRFRNVPGPTATRRSDHVPKRSSGRARRWRRIGETLAVVAILAGLSVALGFWTQRHTVPRGERATVSLPDGSTVELSAGSTLRYAPFWWPGPRAVTLDGEAFFDVQTDDRPFVVETFNARVWVRGTRFNVRAWPDDPAWRTTIALVEGSVDVMPRAADTASVELRPNQMFIVTRDTTETLSAAEGSLNRALAWRSGGLAFVDQPLGTALRELERRFALDITVADAALADQPLTYLNPQPASAEDALTDICHVLDLRYRRTADGFAVLRR